MVRFTDTSLPDLNEGEYSAVLIGVVYLGTHKRTYKGEDKGQCPKAKLIFEIPSQVSAKGETKVISKNIGNLTTNARGSFLPIASVLLGKKLTSEELARYNKNTASPLKETIGKQVTLSIAHFSTDDGTRAYVEEVRVAHPKDDPITATKDDVYFDPYEGTLATFNTLTYYTKSEVMSAVDAKEFPAELHKQWVKDQEQKAKEDGEKESSKTAHSALS